jgi:hypothetical protein
MVSNERVTSTSALDFEGIKLLLEALKADRDFARCKEALRELTAKAAFLSMGAE